MLPTYRAVELPYSVFEEGRPHARVVRIPVDTTLPVTIEHAETGEIIARFSMNSVWMAIPSLCGGPIGVREAFTKLAEHITEIENERDKQQARAEKLQGAVNALTTQPAVALPVTYAPAIPDNAVPINDEFLTELVGP